jgi:hypothetical protein
MMMAGSSSNDCSTSSGEGATEDEGRCSTPEGGATDTTEEAPCNKTSSETHRWYHSDMLGDDHTLHIDIKAPVALVGRGIIEKLAKCWRCKFVGSRGTKVRVT